MAVVSSVVAGVSAVGSAALSARASRKAAGEIRAGQDAATAEQRAAREQAREDFAPWREAGANALNQLQNPLDSFYASPDYEFRRSEGMRDIGNQFAARGGGGNAMKALNQYNSNLAGGEFGNWFNRIFGMSEAGRGATGSTTQAGMNAANNMSNISMNTGNQLAQLGMNNAANINNALQGGISNILYNRRLKMMDDRGYFNGPNKV